MNVAMMVLSKKGQIQKNMLYIILLIYNANKTIYGVRSQNSGAFIDKVIDYEGDKKETSRMIVIFFFLTCVVHKLIDFMMIHAAYFSLCMLYFLKKLKGKYKWQ